MDELPPLFAPGQRLGRYELLQRLAVGGMAEVYLAYAVGPGDFRKVVAIKRLLPQHALDPQLLRMFLDEARLMARLSHPNVPHVTDVDDGRGTDVPYFVMEYVHGTDLRGVLNAAAGPLPIEQALAIASAVAAGLHHAHEQRGAGGLPLEIVHRDVSPSNVLISFDGAVKVTDFGVAKWTEQKSFTHQGQLKGKFAHMSPEQCRGETLDRRSDVFALGTLLYEMTTGEPPFVAESEYDLLTQIVSKDARPARHPGGTYPEQLQSIVMRSLKRAREDRYPSTQQLQLDLEAFAREQRLVVTPVGLEAYLETLFGARVTEWKEAIASGKTLADHLRQPPSNPDARATARERTATDGFANKHARVGLTASRTKTPSVASGGPKAAAGADARPQPARPPPGRRRMTRALAVAGAAAVALAALLVATEVTSRWQRTIRASLIPTSSIGGFLAPSEIAARAVPAKSTSAPHAQTDAVGQAAASTVREGVVAGASSPSLPMATTTTTTRRGRDTGTSSRVNRREPTIAIQPTESIALIRATTAPTPTGHVTIPEPAGLTAATHPAPTPATSPSPPVSPSSPPTMPRAQPQAPVRVWDPDSPVPP